MNWENVSKNKKVIELIKKREEIENKIRNIEKNALIKYEMEFLSLKIDVDEYYEDSE